MGPVTSKSRPAAKKPPRYCPTCGDDLSDYPYYQVRPGPFARRLLTLARALLAIMAMLFLYLLFSGSSPPFYTTTSGYFIVAFVCGPSLLVYSVSLLMSRERRIICLHCSWYRDYPYRRDLFETRS